jgi:catechol 2,3-dioxygenase-like lactoylglutathione lyase family enzyme
MRLEGIHHITAITGDAPANVDFYTRVLGLRMVKKTVNQDDPTVYHLFYADELGSAGADLTFFEYPGARRGRAGRARTHCRSGPSAWPARASQWTGSAGTGSRAASASPILRASNTSCAWTTAATTR